LRMKKNVWAKRKKYQKIYPLTKSEINTDDKTVTEKH
jgi:hypothetical protein